MKSRILSGWTINRVLYLAMGTYIVFQSIIEQQWVGILLGGYFASMGLFAFGCAAGNCGVGYQSERGKNQDTEEVVFDELSSK